MNTSGLAGDREGFSSGTHIGPARAYAVSIPQGALLLSVCAAGQTMKAPEITKDSTI
jgi:hypothetical protein